MIVFTYTTCQMDDPLNNSDADLSPKSFQRKVDDYFAAYHSFLDSSEKEQPKQTRESKISKSDEQKRKEAEYAKAFRIDARRRKILGVCFKVLSCFSLIMFLLTSFFFDF